MKARFNYDLTEVMSLLQEAKSDKDPVTLSLCSPLASQLALTTQTSQLALAQTSQLVADIAAPQQDRIHSERRELIDRAEYLTTLMLQQREKARLAQSNLDITRALSLLKPS